MNSCQTRIYAAEFSAAEIADAVRNGRLLSMEIEFNSVCNFRCIYCYAAENGKRRSELTKEEFKDVITQAKNLGARKIIILGGEPMLYPDIIEMIEFIRGLDMDIELFTNGTGITPAMAKTLYDHAVRVVLKMNSFDEKTQDELSGKKGAYAQIHEAFTNLKQAGYPSADRFMGVSTIICQQNIGELPRMWEWLRDQNIAPYFEMITPQGGAKENPAIDIDTKQAEEFFHMIAEIDRRKYGNRWDPRPPLVGGICLRHQFSCAVSSEGNVQPCVGVTIPIGNVRENTLKDILGNSEVVQDLKRYREMIKGPCASCKDLHECYGCRGAAYQLTGDYLASDPLCWKNLDKKKDIIYLPMDAARLVGLGQSDLLIDRLIEMKERASVSEMTIKAGSGYVDRHGRLQESVYPDIIAQALVAQEGFRKFGSREPKPKGFRTEDREVDVLRTAGVGDLLRIRIIKAARNGDFGMVSGEIYRGEDLIARGRVKVIPVGPESVRK